MELKKTSKCPRCGGSLRGAVAMDGGESPFWVECSNPFCPTYVDTFSPTTMQYNFLKDGHRFKGTFGGFGCHDKDGKILMHDGTIKNVKEIKVGDLLMGPDSTPRKVLKLHRGEDEMYEITPKGMSTPIRLNGGHILHLHNKYYTGIEKRGHKNYYGQEANITIKEYLEHSDTFKFGHFWKFSQGFEYEEKPIPIDPYLLGIILGDGSITQTWVDVTSNDEEIYKYCKKIAPEYDTTLNTNFKKGTKTRQMRFTKNTTKKGNNQLVNRLRELDLMGKNSKTKFIPQIYKNNSSEIRLKILAGLVDSDGYMYSNIIEITSASKRLAEDIKEIAQSLGIRSAIRLKRIKKYPDNVYYRIVLGGPNTDKIPALLKRKRTNSNSNKRYDIQRFDIKKISDKEKYYGFEVDGDNLYIEADNFSIIHNSGKSLAVIKQVQKHALITPGGKIAVIGSTYRLINRNFLKDFTEDFPRGMVVGVRNQKIFGFNQSDMLITLKNGTTIELITADKEEKIRGMNAGLVVHLEASNIPGNIIEGSKSRLRHLSAVAYKKDENGKEVLILDEKTGEWIPEIEATWRQMIFESNPDAGYIRTELLLKANRIMFYGSSYEKYSYNLENIDEGISMHISATDSNPYLPPNYVEDNTRGKPLHFVRRFYFGSFLFGEHMVYPRFHERVVDAYPINWDNPDLFALIGYDYGLANESAFVFLTFNFKTKKLHAYDELVIVNMDVKEITTEYRKKLSTIPKGKLLLMPAMDGMSYGKRQADKRTIGEMFEELGIYFDPVQEGTDVRTFQLNTLINEEMITFSRQGVPNLIEDVTGYKWAVNSKGEVQNKRVDKDNHTIDALEFAIVRLPYNLETMTVAEWIRPGHLIVADRNQIEKKPELTPVQKFNKGMNPLNQTFERSDSFDYLEEEDDDELMKILDGLPVI